MRGLGFAVLACWIVGFLTGCCCGEIAEDLEEQAAIIEAEEKARVVPDQVVDADDKATEENPGEQLPSAKERQDSDPPEKKAAPNTENPKALEDISAITKFRRRAKFDVAGVTLGSMRISQGRKWRFDRHGRRWFEQEADKDAVFLWLDHTVTSNDNNPVLPGFLVYAATKDTLKLLGQMETRFQRWEDYGTYLGNYHDSNNDFAKRSTIKFTSGLQLKKEQIKGKALVVMATNKGCLERKYERFANPPISYTGHCGPVPSSITGRLKYGVVVGVSNKRALKQ